MRERAGSRLNAAAWGGGGGWRRVAGGGWPVAGVAGGQCPQGGCTIKAAREKGVETAIHG